MRSYFLWLAKLLTIFALFFCFLFVLGQAFKLNVAKEASLKKDKYTVAVIELSGVIMDAKDVLIEIRKQINNDKVKGIVLRIDSPGGAVGASQDLFYGIKELKKKKPIIASFGNITASGGFYTAMAATKVVSEPGSLTGSIGVIIQLPNYSKVAEKIGVSFVTIKSGKFKDTGNPFRTMKEEERALLEENINDVQKQFVKAVADSRGLKIEEVKKFADGRVFSGKQALEYGVVDKLGDLYTAARLVFEELGEPIPKDKIPSLYFPDYKYKKFKELFNSFSTFFRSALALKSFGIESRSSVKLYYLM